MCHVCRSFDVGKQFSCQYGLPSTAFSSWTEVDIITWQVGLQIHKWQDCSNPRCTLDSTHFGHLRLDLPENSRVRETARKVCCCVSYPNVTNISIIFIHWQAASYLEGYVESKSEEKTLDPRVYCKLGHLYLLLENFGKGLSCCSSSSVRHWSFLL